MYELHEIAKHSLEAYEGDGTQDWDKLPSGWRYNPKTGHMWSVVVGMPHLMASGRVDVSNTALVGRDLPGLRAFFVM